MVWQDSEESDEPNSDQERMARNVSSLQRRLRSLLAKNHLRVIDLFHKWDRNRDRRVTIKEVPLTLPPAAAFHPHAHPPPLSIRALTRFPLPSFDVRSRHLASSRPSSRRNSSSTTLTRTARAASTPKSLR